MTFIVTVQVPVPEHPLPLQPANVDPLDGDAVSVTTVPVGKPAEQSAVQLMPDGVLVTLPDPVPARFTLSVFIMIGALNVAVTV